MNKAITILILSLVLVGCIDDSQTNNLQDISSNDCKAGCSFYHEEIENNTIMYSCINKCDYIMRFIYGD